MHPIVGLKLSEQLRERIEERIVAGEYAPGARLDEGELAHDFGVSRTPIREALIQLASAGFVETRPRRGAVVDAVLRGDGELAAARVRAHVQVQGDRLASLSARLAAGGPPTAADSGLPRRSPR